jgi:nitrogenase molybdenum-iron protein alpha chain
MPITPFKPISIQERRIGAIDAYYGPVAPLIDGIKNGQFAQRIRTMSQTKNDDITSVIRLLQGIKGTVTIVHGAGGCSSIVNFLEGVDGEGSRVISTDLSEDNSIMGAEDKLRTAIIKSFEWHNPQAIFVVTTPIVAINNDDIQSVVVELSAELNIPVIPVYSDGFKSKLASNGYDLGFHSLAHYLIPHVKETKKEQVNIITSTEHAEDIKNISELVSSLKVNPNIFPRMGGIGNFLLSSSSLLSIVPRSEGRLLGEYLEKEMRIPAYYFSPPIGIAGTSQWLRNLSEKVGRQKEADLFLQSHENAVGAFLREQPLTGKKIYISGEISVAIGLSDLVEEYGGRVVGLSITSIDKNTIQLLEDSYAKHQWDFPIHVGDGQLFEQINIIRRLTPDLYLGEWGQTPQVAQSGIPSICHSALPLYGYDAAVHIVHKLLNADRTR